MNYFIELLKNEKSIYSKIEKIQNGDQTLRKIVIKEYTPFIIKIVTNHFGRYINIENGEEFYIGLAAFNEALNNYEAKFGRPFFMFCRKLIKNHLIDYCKNNSYLHSVYTSQDQNYSPFKSGNVDNNDNQYEKIDTIDKINIFKYNLKEYNISFDDLVLYTPRNNDIVRQCIKTATMIANDNYLYNIMSRNKTVPINEIMKFSCTDHNIIEKNRKYIIAVCLMIRTDLHVLKGYIKRIYEGGITNE